MIILFAGARLVLVGLAAHDARWLPRTARRSPTRRGIGHHGRGRQAAGCVEDAKIR
jgi:hypothetical protein